MKKSNNRWKNPWFYVGIIGVILTAIGVDGSTFTTWGAVAKGFMDFIQNPFLIGSCHRRQCDRLHQGHRSGQSRLWGGRLCRGHPQHDYDDFAFDCW